ncbi:hypothetical protein GCM10027174_31540 [Salinifilum aidingensis]
MHRRGDEDLVLTTALRAQQDSEVVSASARVFAAMMQRDPDGARSLMLDVLPQAFPWVRLLPADDRTAFIDEFVDALRAVEDLDNPAAVVHVITTWRHTAEVCADPELHEVLATDGADHGPASAPPVDA